MRVLKKKVQKEGIIKTLKQKQYYKNLLKLGERRKKEVSRTSKRR